MTDAEALARLPLTWDPEEDSLAVRLLFHPRFDSWAEVVCHKAIINTAHGPELFDIPMLTSKHTARVLYDLTVENGCAVDENDAVASARALLAKWAQDEADEEVSNAQ